MKRPIRIIKIPANLDIYINGRHCTFDITVKVRGTYYPETFDTREEPGDPAEFDSTYLPTITFVDYGPGELPAEITDFIIRTLEYSVDNEPPTTPEDAP